MRKRVITIFVLVAVLLSTVGGLGPALAATGDPVLINEVLASHAGTDNTEYIELFGTPGTSLDGLSLIVVESSNISTVGDFDERIDFGPGDVLGSNGFYLVGNATGLQANYNVTPNVDIDPNLENDNLTVALVETSSISGNSVSGSEVVLDAIALQDSNGGTFFFGAPVIGPDGPYFPAGARRETDGVDTDMAADWVISDFNLGPDNTPTGGDTPPPPPPPSVSIHDIQFTTDPSGDSPYEGQTVTTQGIVTAFFYDYGRRYTFIQDGTGPWSGLLLYRPNGYINVGDLLEVEGEVSEYYGLTEIAYGDVTVLSPGTLPTPEVLSSGDVNQEQWESVLVRVENVTVTDEDLGNGEWLVDDTSGGVRVDDLGDYGYSPTNGDLLDFVQGPLFYDWSNFKIEPRDNSDISIVRSICQIQGDGLASPYEGQTVRTQGVVSADFQATDKRGVFLQDPTCDGDPTTSDGIFVYDKWIPVDAGDEIVITGEVSEYYGMTEISGVWGRVTVLSEDNPLPTPIELIDLQDESIPDATAFWEALEGMLVSVRNAPVVAPTSYYGEFAMLAKDDAKPGSGFYPQTQQILIRNLGGEEVDYNPERILVDDDCLDEAIVVMPGDRMRSLVGAVDYTFSNYKLQPTSFDVKTHNLPNLPASTRSGPKGDTVITTFNVENLFDLVDNPDKDDGSSTPSPAELEIKLTKLSLAIQVELELPEIIVVQEVENTEILQELGDRVNAAAGTGYVATSFETSDARGIEVGFLWDDDRVDLLDAYQMSGPDVEAAFGLSSPSPGREPLVGMFEIEGKVVTIVGNHFKSKGGDDPLFGVNWPPIRVTEDQRKAQAQVVRDFVNAILDVNADALVMVTGDLNDFQFGEPGEGADHPVAILEGGPGEVTLTNLLNLEKEAETYTYVYDGNSQVLDHMLVSPALLDLFAAVDVLHFNAGYPDGLGEDAGTPLKVSDHDPLEGRFNFR
jgi:predicted extracellular nuclease